MLQDLALSGVSVMIILDEPRHPVQDPEPGFAKTVANFRLMDWALPPALAAGLWPIGYFGGLKNKVPHSSAAVAAYLGASCGFMLAYQGSFGRLAGLKSP